MQVHMHVSLEQLEGRRLLSVANLTSEGVFKVKGDDGVNDNLQVRKEGGNLVAIINGTTVETVDIDDVEGIKIVGGSGDDILKVDDTTNSPIKISATLCGNDGNDRLVSSNSVANRLRAGAGNDRLDGRGVLVGGDGNDRFDASNFKDYLFGGTGRDSLDAEDGNDALFGGDDNDTLEGGFGNDSLFGNNDDDRLDGGFGDDQLYGNAGADSLFGDDGDDSLYGGADEDHLNGNEGTDLEDPEEFEDIDDLIDDLLDQAGEMAV